MNEWEKCVPWRRNFKLRTGDLLTEKYCDDLKVISGDHLLLLKVARDKILVMTYILNNVVTIWYHLKTEHDKLIRRQEISYCYGSLNKKVRWHAFTKAHLIKIEYCYGSLDQDRILLWLTWSGGWWWLRAWCRTPAWAGCRTRRSPCTECRDRQTAAIIVL